MRPVIREYKVVDHFQAGTSTVLGLDKKIDVLAGDYVRIDGKRYFGVRNSIDSWITIPDLKLDSIPEKVVFES